MVSLENEYFEFKTELKQEEEKLAKLESTEIIEDENNPFSVEERIESKNRSIKSTKENIEELKSLIAEVKEELIKFIDEGGEVSEKTKESIGYFESIRVYFDVSSVDSNVHYEGYVNINDEEAENVDWVYYNRDGTKSYEHRVILHKNEETGLTDEQNMEQFIEDEYKINEWITDIILQSEEDENRTYKKGNILVKINDGAKMECEIKEPSQYRGDFIVEVIPRFNGKFINLAKYMSETGETFDPYGGCDEYFSIEENHIYFEISKDYFEGDNEDKEYNVKVINEEARRIYARYLTRELCIWSIYGEAMEQSMDSHYDNEWLFKMNQMVDKSDEELDAFLREEGLIDEELDY